eukprot:356712-Chlamydomonas_euryale.AAC.10
MMRLGWVPHMAPLGITEGTDAHQTAGVRTYFSGSGSSGNNFLGPNKCRVSLSRHPCMALASGMNGCACIGSHERVTPCQLTVMRPCCCWMC